MTSFKTFALWLLLFSLASTLRLSTPMSMVEPDDERPFDEEEHVKDISERIHNSRNRNKVKHTTKPSTTTTTRWFHIGSASQIKDHEIKSISLQIWNSEPDIDVQYDGKEDRNGSRKLFLQKESTNKAIDVQVAFRKLFPFYEKYRGKEDPCVIPKSSKECDEKQNLFLDHIFNRIGPIKVLHDNLYRRGIFKYEYTAFKIYLKTMWFTPYSRSGGTVLDSSAFEHVFLGEITKNGTVDGMHNWMRMYVEEGGRHFKLNKDPIYYTSDKPLVARVAFSWGKGHDKTKKGSTFFMRKSPAVEIALYTLCFMVRPYNPSKPCWIDVGPFRLEVRALPWENDNSIIFTAYPVP